MENDNLELNNNEENKINNEENKDIDNKETHEGLFSQAEVDRKITEAIKTREKKLRDEFEKKIAEEIEKKTKLSQLSEEDRKQVEIDEKIKAFEERERELNFRELRADFSAEVAKNGLPLDAVDLLLSKNDTVEVAYEKLKSFKSIIEQASKEFLETKMRENSFSPKVGKPAETTVQDFLKMNYEQKLQLSKDNPALYQELNNKVKGL